MNLLIESIEKTANIAAGYTIGTLVLENHQIYIQLENGELVPVTSAVEVKNGDHWRRLSATDIHRKTAEGWPAYAGLSARIKREEVHG